MKKIFTLVLFFPLVFSACYDFTNVETPERLSVSSHASYALPAGELSFNLMEDLNIARVQEILEKNSSSSSNETSYLEVYDYNPTQNDNDVLQYVINYRIKEIPVSISADSDIGDVNFSTEFPIPDFSENIKNTLSADDHSFPIVEGLDASISDVTGGQAYIYYRITSPEFKTMHLRSGSLKVEIKPESAPSSGFSMPIKLSLVSEVDPSKVISSSGYVECAVGGTILLDLTEADLVPSMLLLIDGSTSGGTPGKQNTYKASFSTENISLAKITGLTMKDEDLTPNSHVDIDESFELKGVNKALKSARIKSGSMEFACVFPEGWEGITCKKSNFSLSGGITLSDEKFTDKTAGSDFLRREADLAGLSIIPQDVATTGSFIELEIKDATIVFSGNGDKVALSGSLKIDEIDEIVLDLSFADFNLNNTDTISTGFNMSTLLSDIFEGEESDLIKNIKFSGIGAYFYVTQPTDNEILNAISITGKVSATYDGSGNPVYLVGSESEDATFKVKKNTINFKNLADENSVITSSVLFDEHENQNENLYSSKINDNAMADLINAQPDGLAFNYSLGISGENGTEVVLDNEDIKTMTTKSALSISLAIILPVQIILDDVSDGNPADKTVIIDDVLSLVGSKFDDDMLQRDTSADGEDWLDYTPIIKNIGMKYEFDNHTPLDNLTLVFIEDKCGIVKELTTESGEHKIEFSRDEIERICKTYPFTPVIQAKLTGADGETIRGFSRNAHFIFNAQLKVETDGTIKVWDKDDE